MKTLLATKLCNKNLINTWTVFFIKYSGLFLKGTKEELRQMDQKSMKLMTMNKAIHPKDDIGRKKIKRTRHLGLYRCINTKRRLVCFSLVSLFNDISTFVGYLMTNDPSRKTVPGSICPKVDVIARLKFELAYYDSAVHRFNHYTTRTPLPK